MDPPARAKPALEVALQHALGEDEHAVTHAISTQYLPPAAPASGYTSPAH